MKRDDVIKQVADAVGSRHKVDLTNYELLILVDIYRVRGNKEPLILLQCTCITALANLSAEHIGNERGWERLCEAETLQLSRAV